MKWARYIIIALLAAALWFIFRNVNLVSLFVASGVILIIVYWLFLRFRFKQQASLSNIVNESAFLSAACFILLFFFSVNMMRSYQLPRGTNPYFNNADHHAIRNYGIAFRDSLVFYYNEDNVESGLFACDTGSFTIVPGKQDKPVFHLNNFFVPVFRHLKEDRTALLNPLYTENVSPGFALTDGQSTLRWTKVDVQVKDEVPVFEMTFIFSSNDEELLGNTPSGFSDTITVDSLKLMKGLDLRTVLLQAASAPGRQYVFRWLDHYSKIYLLTVQDSASLAYGLTIFPQHDFFATGRVLKDDRVLLPQATIAVDFDTLRQFHVGLENAHEPYALRKRNPNEKFLQAGIEYILELKGMNYLPVSTNAGSADGIGATEIRFLKNSYARLEIDEIRQGFLFHDNMKNNAFTAFNALFEYRLDHTGVPLQWEVHNLNPSQGSSPSKPLFFLQSENAQIGWLFSIHDLADNKFNFKHAVWYLALVTFFIILLVTLRPGVNVLYIETPLLIVVYIYFTYRLLLMWRVATFPPMENIRLPEFNNLREFDLALFNINTWLPVSVWIIVAALVLVFLYRSYQSFFLKFIPAARKLSPFVLHLLVLLGCSALLKFIKVDVIVRIAAIVIPCGSYFYFAYRSMKNKERIKYTAPASKNGAIQYLFRLLSTWIDSPLFFISLFTLLYFAIWDTGFAILFLFFLVIKTIFFSFIRFDPKPREEEKQFPFHWVYGVLALVLLYFLLWNKKTLWFMLLNKTYFIAAGMILSIIIAFILLRGIGRKIAWSLAPAFVLLLLIIPWSRNKIEGGIDNKVRNVVYRASILFQPVEDMLFNYEYNSSKERKIIETAQNQWFINSYLDSTKTDFTSGRKINFRPHFKTGVDYITQTRDVVLPRYVIGEFGGLTMFLLLVLIALPFVIFFLSYRLADKDANYLAGSGIAAMACILLFTIGLIIWLASTNRFAFFGQDFPFLSLTSRISTLLPALLVVIVLLQKPVIRSRKPTWLFWVIFFIALSAVALFGKSGLLPAGTFKVDFKNIANRINKDINLVYDEVQRDKLNRYTGLTNGGIIRDSTVNEVRRSLDQLFADQDFKAIYDKSTVYEKSILNNLRDNPRLGFDLRNPVHLKYQKGKLNFAFNEYFRLELPVYELKNVWKGDIKQAAFRPDSLQRVYHERLNGNRADLVTIPASYLLNQQGDAGLFNLQGKSPDDYLKAYVYSGKSRLLKKLNPESFVEILDESDIVFLKDPVENHRGNKTINKNKEPYFAYSFQINGKQRHIYPMGKKFYWIRHWAALNKLHYEKSGELNAGTKLAIDFALTDSVNTLIQSGLRKFESKIPELNFSVIAADGAGRIRLMADFDVRREILDPNDSRAIAKKERDQYFIVNSEAERFQWGNVNLLRMAIGPGSSIKPVVASAVASQLNVGWQDVQYVEKPGLPAESKEIEVPNYAGLQLGHRLKLGAGHNRTTSFVDYIKNSNNLYHSAIMFLGSYQKSDFANGHGYSFNSKLSNAPASSLCDFPVLHLNGSNQNLYFPTPQSWPVTYVAAPGTRDSYFGNANSLLAKGLGANFGLLCEAQDKYSAKNQKHNFSALLPDSATQKNIWAFPEESYFFQVERDDPDRQENFFKGLWFPTIGAVPYEVTPYKMLEMYGALASVNNNYNLKIDSNNSLRSGWNFDRDTWHSLEAYKTFHSNYIMVGMREVLANGGTGELLLNSLSAEARNYHIYAKTGTIGDESAEENSKRLAVIISKEPIENSNNIGSPFYVVFFTINNAYRKFDQGQDRTWYWTYYQRIINHIVQSQSFKSYMNGGR